jgi:DNA mismatch repair ATPase MutL
MKTLALNILDIVQNSIRASADEITVSITESVKEDLFRIIIEDNGTGIPKEILKNVTDPFVTTRTRRRMGLGLSLLKYHAEITGGGIEIKSEEKSGTRVKAVFSNKHIDRQPLGDIAGVISILIASNPGIEFIYNHKTDSGIYSFSTKETKEFLETDELTCQALLQDIVDMINSNLTDINVSGLDIKAKALQFFIKTQLN